MHQIAWTAGNSNQIVEALLKYQMDDDPLSHRIFKICPINESRELEMCQYEPLSPWVFEYMLQVCKVHEANAASRPYVRLSGMPWAVSFRAMFEK